MKSALASITVLFGPAILTFMAVAAREPTGGSGARVIQAIIWGVCCFVASAIVIVVNYAGPRWW